MRLKTLILGAVLAAAAGSAGGDAFRPVLATSRTAMPAVAFAAGLDAPLDPAGVWAGPGPAPDYVIRTGWPTPPIRDVQASATLESDRDRADPEPESPPAWAEIDEREWAAPSYPSESGDILAGASKRIASGAGAASQAD